MIFVDTSFLVALLLVNDMYNKRANVILDYIENENLVINNTVLNETINFLTKCNKMKQGNVIDELVDILLNSCEVYYLTKNDYSISIDLFKCYGGAINFSDCTILRAMENLGINQIVSFDKDFDKINGIKRLY